MGKERYRVGGKSSKRGAGGRGGADKDNATTPSGCLCSVFQLFDFHQFQFPSPHEDHPSLKPEAEGSFLPHATDPPISKGAEAPRNSLELDEPSSPTTVDENLDVPMDIQIETNGSTSSKAHGGSNDSCSSEISSSPSSKTPTLVARLMGLDLLPDQTYSPTFSSSALGTPNHSYPRRQSMQIKRSNHRNRLDTDVSGTRSLPETPRISSARRSDVEHRLSLQINKENLSPSEHMALLSLKRKELKTEEDNRSSSPGHYARQIVKQVKESVSRKVGSDITKTIRNRDELVSQLKSKKMTKVLTKVGADDSSAAAASCSPRLKFLESRNRAMSLVLSTKDHITSQPLKPSVSSPAAQVNIMPQKTKAPTKAKSQAAQEQVYLHQQHNRPIKKCKKVGEERFGPPPRLKRPPQTSDIIRNKQEQLFVRPATATRANIPDKKCKKTPLSNNLLNITVPTLLPLKKDPIPPPRKTPQNPALNAQEWKRSTQLSSCSSHSYKQEAVHTKLDARGSSSNNNNNEDRSNDAAVTTTTSTGDEAAECEYITRILKSTGIDNDTPVSFTRWFSPSHPLDPSIFYYFEYFATISNSISEKYSTCGQLSHRCNRKLLFYLVDEILVEILKPYMNMKPWSTITTSSNMKLDGSHLIDMLCSKIRSFPCADCRVLEDIDALVDQDMPQLKVQSDVAFEEEGDGIVTEIEKDLLDELIHETAVIFNGV